MMSLEDLALPLSLSALRGPPKDRSQDGIAHRGSRVYVSRATG